VARARTTYLAVYGLEGIEAVRWCPVRKECAMADGFYFNIETHQVEEGRQSDYTKLMGPYPTREAAEQALETARRRNQSWDAQDEQG